jgi:hypothetical protein
MDAKQKTTGMSPEEKIQFNGMNISLNALRTDFTVISGKVDKVVGAILGNEFTQDGGLVARIKHLESQNDKLQGKVQEIQNSNTKMSWKMGLLWACAGAISASAFAFLLGLLFKHP